MAAILSTQPQRASSLFLALATLPRATWPIATSSLDTRKAPVSPNPDLAGGPQGILGSEAQSEAQGKGEAASRREHTLLLTGEGSADSGGSVSLAEGHGDGAQWRPTLYSSQASGSRFKADVPAEPVSCCKVGGAFIPLWPSARSQPKRTPREGTHLSRFNSAHV